MEPRPTLGDVLRWLHAAHTRMVAGQGHRSVYYSVDSARVRHSALDSRRGLLFPPSCPLHVLH